MGKSETLLGQALRAHRGAPAYVATKIPPKNMKWPGKAEYPVAGHLSAAITSASTPRRASRTSASTTIDLQQFHVWSDAWADGRRLAARGRRPEARGAGARGRHQRQPVGGDRTCCARSKTGLIDSVQVVYNIFDQAPEDELFPYCQAHDIAVIARVPFDEGSLTGTLTPDSSWPEGDWRNIYFNREHLAATLARVERLSPLVPEGMDLPELALRFILEHPAVSTTIPGMRRPAHVERNLAASDGVRLPPRLGEALKTHRWDRGPNATP